MRLLCCGFCASRDTFAQFRQMMFGGDWTTPAFVQPGDQISPVCAWARVFISFFDGFLNNLSALPIRATIWN